MSIFVIGREGRFEVAHECFVLEGGVGRNPFTDKPIKYGPSFRLRREGRNITLGAPMKRGVAIEGKGFFARVLPADAETELADFDRRIEEKRAELSEAFRERQEFLAVSILRGERISRKHVTETKATAGEE